MVYTQPNTVQTDCAALQALLASTTGPVSLKAALLQQQCITCLASGCVCNAGAPVTSVKFDNSGQYLAVGGMDARIYGVKQEWQLLSTLSDLPQKVSLAYSSDMPAACNYVCLLFGDCWPTE